MRLEALFAGILGSLLGTPALGCMCSTGDPPAAFNRATAVFIGTFVSGTEQFYVPSPDGTPRPLEAGQLKLVVDEVFKGRVGPETLFEIPSDRGTSCVSYGLVRGERYLFYAYSPKRERTLIVGAGACSRTALMNSDAVREDLRFLRNLPPAGSGGTLRASVYEDRLWFGYRPFAGITLQLQGPDRQLITATTDAAGRLEVKGLKPGRYRVAPQYPAHYDGGHEREHDEVEIDDLGAADVQIEVFVKGQLLGRAMDTRGQPFNHLRPRLLPADLLDEPYAFPSFGESTGSGGNFEFKGVPPGRYLLYVDLEDPHSNRPRRFFYPGTFDAAAAATLDVGLAEIKRGVDFRLPSTFRVRNVTGRVTWPDGRPAAGALIELRCASSGTRGGLVLETYASEVIADDAGRFVLDAIAAQSYWLEARASDPNKSSDVHQSMMHAPRIRIGPGEAALKHDLVLTQPDFYGGCDPW